MDEMAVWLNRGLMRGGVVCSQWMGAKTSNWPCSRSSQSMHTTTFLVQYRKYFTVCREAGSVQGTRALHLVVLCGPFPVRRVLEPQYACVEPSAREQHHVRD